MVACPGGAGAASGRNPSGRRSRGCIDDIPCIGQGRGGIYSVAEDRGGQGDCAVAVDEPERDICAEFGGKRVA